MNFIKQGVIKNFLFNSGHKFRDHEEYRKIELINIFLIILLSFLSLFIITNIVVGLYVLAILETVAFFMLLATLYYFHRSSNVKEASVVIISVLTLFLDLFFFNVGQNFYSFYFMVIIFPIAYFLLGSRIGTIFSLFYLTYHSLFIMLLYKSWEPAIFNHNSLINIVGGSLGLIFLIHYYESTRMQTQKMLNEKNEELFLLSITDGLTGLYNRRHFNEVGQKQLNSAKRFAKKFCFAILDIDNFKKYNDNYGHNSGDDVLQTIGNILNESMHRSEDFAFRIGGEEFVLIFMSNDEKSALEYIESIREHIEALHIEHSYNEEYNIITISAGFVCLDTKDINEIDDVYKEADKLLYKAKNSGRNRVISNI